MHRCVSAPARPCAQGGAPAEQPALLARDVAAFAEGGFRLSAVRGFDAFPMTAHVECVALLVPASS